jgi:hypothetical protein
MTTVRRIVTSKIDGGDANNTDTNEIRPFGETAFYIDSSGPDDKLELLMFDGVRTNLKSKVLGKGKLYGGDADSGDGLNYDTIKLIPDAELHRDDGSYNNDQYLIIDPTGGEPNHIHIRAGGDIDQSRTDLFLGGEKNNLRVSDVNDQISITTDANFDNVTHTWTFGNDGNLSLPGSINGLIGESEPGLVVRSDLGFVVTTNASAPFTEYQVEFTGYIDNGTGTGQSGATLTVVQVVAGTITDGMTIYGDGLPPEGWTLTFGGVTGELGSGGPGTYGLVGANLLTSLQTFNNNVPESGGPKNWVFDDDGTLRLPLSNNDLYPAYNNRALIKTFADIQISAGDDVGSNWIFGVDGSLTLPNTNPSASPAVSSIISTTPLRVTSNGSTWTFNGDGNLTFPDNTTQNTAWTGTSSYDDLNNKPSFETASILIVDPLGNDSIADGTITKPYATIQAAHDYAAANISTLSDVVIQINPGYYSENVTLTRVKTHLLGMNSGETKTTRINGTLTINSNSIFNDVYTDNFTVENLIIGSTDVTGNIVTLAGSTQYSFIARDTIIYASTSGSQGIVTTNTSNDGIYIDMSDCTVQTAGSASNAIDLNNVFSSILNNCIVLSGTGFAARVVNSNLIATNTSFRTNSGSKVVDVVSGFGTQFNPITAPTGSVGFIASNCSFQNSVPNNDGIDITAAATALISRGSFVIVNGTGFAIKGVAGSFFINGDNLIFPGMNVKVSSTIGAGNIPLTTSFTAA